ncbi:uncharacterized protein MCYG_05821 [Microsporum canis CBS 113480]|uniref:Uncharacterized protein n=1 Tax=Arthroderma otae (strain ATCC MYA-4605 / CBS 113480) TaxID=554155 RepID=C5FSZ9_ARTOC|nr:uncharacterized protein MCYG_05821 [Microsporum canis CBS 113480]EEQ33002.1 predicted protein [Microsporum canis CBS 113480]
MTCFDRIWVSQFFTFFIFHSFVLSSSVTGSLPRKTSNAQEDGSDTPYILRITHPHSGNLSFENTRFRRHNRGRGGLEQSVAAKKNKHDHLLGPAGSGRVIYLCRQKKKVAHPYILFIGRITSRKKEDKELGVGLFSFSLHNSLQVGRHEQVTSDTQGLHEGVGGYRHLHTYVEETTALDVMSQHIKEPWAAALHVQEDSSGESSAYEPAYTYIK